MSFPLSSGAAKHHVTRVLGMTTVALTVGAEAANVIPITVQLGDVAGNSIASPDAWIAEVIGEAAAAFVLAEDGVGAELGNTARPAIAFTLDANGAATIDVTDVVGASGDTVIVGFRPADGMSVPAYATAIFD